MSTDYSKLTVVQLKNELKRKNLPVSGKKQDLIERLQSSKKLAQRRRPSSVKVTKSEQEICEAFKNTPHINPSSGRSLKPGSSVHKKLVERCNSYAAVPPKTSTSKITKKSSVKEMKEYIMDTMNVITEDKNQSELYEFVKEKIKGLLYDELKSALHSKDMKRFKKLVSYGAANIGSGTFPVFVVREVMSLSEKERNPILKTLFTSRAWTSDDLEEILYAIRKHHSDKYNSFMTFIEKTFPKIN
jgi:hypothetical protein